MKDIASSSLHRFTRTGTRVSIYHGQPSAGPGGKQKKEGEGTKDGPKSYSDPLKRQRLNQKKRKKYDLSQTSLPGSDPKTPESPAAENYPKRKNEENLSGEMRTWLMLSRS